MATNIFNKKYNTTTGKYITEYLCDDDTDFANLPIAEMGSTATSLGSGKVGIVNGLGEWVTLTSGGSGGGSGSSAKVIKKSGGKGTPVIGTWDGMSEPTEEERVFDCIYFNTSLSVEGVNEILSKLSYGTNEYDEPCICAMTGYSLDGGSCYVDIYKYDDGFNIEFNNSDSGLSVFNSSPEESGYNFIGWNSIFSGKGMIKSALVVPGANLGNITVDNQQEMYADLISLTPFEESTEEITLSGEYDGSTITTDETTVDIGALLEEKKLPLNVKVNGGSGKVVCPFPIDQYTSISNVYFNTALSNNEVNDIIQNYIDNGGLGEDGVYYVFLGGSEPSTSWAGISLQVRNGSYLIVGGDPSQGIESILYDSSKGGWQSDVVAQYNGWNLNHANNYVTDWFSSALNSAPPEDGFILIANLISTEPFENITTLNSKYYDGSTFYVSSYEINMADLLAQKKLPLRIVFSRPS